MKYIKETLTEKCSGCNSDFELHKLKHGRCKQCRHENYTRALQRERVKPPALITIYRVSRNW
jgi:DNA-directed RNA polymerase subunit RPC12/RpoP